MRKLSPKWDWSDDYRKHAVGHDRDLRKAPLRHEYRVLNRDTGKEFRSDRDISTAYRMAQYAHYLLRRDGDTTGYFRASVDIGSGVVWFGDTPVSIPYFDWEPVVIEEEHSLDLIAA